MIDHLQFELTKATSFAAEIAVRPQFHTLPEQWEGFRFTGTIRGPFCATSHTLPSEFSLQHDTTSAEPLLTARIIDPCYATDELPMEYEIEVQAWDGETLQGECRTRVGLRCHREHGGGAVGQ